MKSLEWIQEALGLIEINSANTPVRDMPEVNIPVGTIGLEYRDVRKLYILLVELQREVIRLKIILARQLEQEVREGRGGLECVCCECDSCFLRNTIHSISQQLLVVESLFLSELDSIFSDEIALLRASKVINVSAGWLVSVSFGPLTLVEGSFGRLQKNLIPSLS